MSAITLEAALWLALLANPALPPTQTATARVGEMKPMEFKDGRHGWKFTLTIRPGDWKSGQSPDRFAIKVDAPTQDAWEWYGETPENGRGEHDVLVFCVRDDRPPHGIYFLTENVRPDVDFVVIVWITEKRDGLLKPTVKATAYSPGK